MTKSASMPFSDVSGGIEADLVTFTEEILTGKLHFLCGVSKIC